MHFLYNFLQALCQNCNTHKYISLAKPNDFSNKLTNVISNYTNRPLRTVPDSNWYFLQIMILINAEKHEHLLISEGWEIPKIRDVDMEDMVLQCYMNNKCQDVSTSIHRLHKFLWVTVCFFISRKILLTGQHVCWQLVILLFWNILTENVVIWYNNFKTLLSTVGGCPLMGVRSPFLHRNLSRNLTKGGQFFMVSFSDLFTYTLVIIAIITLVSNRKEK